MKKLTLFLIGIISTLCVDAQILPFEVEAPNVKFIKSKNGVNIRQQPSVNSKRLIMDNDEDSEYGWGNVKWSNSMSRGYKAMQFKNGVSFREQDGWYFIENIFPFEAEITGWVSAKYCETFIPEPINYLKMKYNEDCYCPAIKWISGTNEFKNGEYVLILEGGEDIWVPINLYLGKLSEGLIICPFKFPLAIDWDSIDGYSDSTSFSLKRKTEKNEYGTYWYLVPPRNDESANDEDRLNDSFVNDLLTKVEPEKLKTPCIYYLYNGCLHASDSPELF